MDEQLTVGSLFAGIGGFDLGLERAGMQTVWFCEQDPFCQRVLARHWPGVPCHPDVRALVANTNGRGLHRSSVRAQQPERAEALSAGEGDRVPVPVPYVDVLCGGFPCQDLSYAGRGAGLAGERSGLWREFARLIGELRPRYVIVENVPALTHRGLDVVLGDLAACGFDAEWDHLPASAFGAPHRRDRIWLVAYPNSDGGRQQERAQLNGSAASYSSNGHPRRRHAHGLDHEAGFTAPLGDPDAERRNGRTGQLGPGRRGEPAHPGGREPQSGLGRMAHELSGGLDSGWWNREPDIPRVAVGVPQRVDRLRALGNALVPQIAEWLGNQIIEWERVTA